VVTRAPQLQSSQLLLLLLLLLLRFVGEQERRAGSTAVVVARSPSLSLSLVVHGHRENRTGNTLTSAGRVTTPVVGLGTAVQCPQHGSALGWPGVGLRGTGRAGPGHSYGWAPGNECAPQIVGIEELLGQLLHWVGSF